MSGAGGGVGEVRHGSVPREAEATVGATHEPVLDEGTWTASRILHTFSQIAFAYGASAVFASVSALLMSLPLGSPEWSTAAAIVPFVISVAISSSVLVDLLEFLWDGIAGRFLDARGPGSRLWSAMLGLLLAGMSALAAGVAVGALAFGDREDYGFLVPVAVALLAACGLFLLIAMVLPSLVLAPSPRRWMAAAAACLGGVAVVSEALVSETPPVGLSPVMGWMEGAFPLLNWNLVFGAMVAASAFLTWESYRSFLPAATRVAVPA